MEALGREPNINSLKLNLAKVKRSKNDSIIVDNYFKTSNKNIYAIGDVIDRVQLTPVAIAEAMHIVNNIFNKSKNRLNIQIFQLLFFPIQTLHV